MIQIAVFASGSGTNAENLIKSFGSDSQISVKLVVTNNPKAFVITRAKNLGVQSIVLKKGELSSTGFANHLNKEVDGIVLAGFLKLIPESLLAKFPDRILNIHPSLLPKYGGPGMFGSHVHESVLKNRELESGITIHLVNKEYDKGRILFQKSTKIETLESIETLQKKIHKLEYDYFPRVVKDHFLDAD